MNTAVSMIRSVILYSTTTQLFAIGKIAAIVYIHLNGWQNGILCLSYSCSYSFRYFLQRCEPNRLKKCMVVICNSVQESCLISSLPSYSFTPLTIRSLKEVVHAKLLINLSFALLGLYVTFIISTVSTGVPVLCGVVSVLMHYFFLAVFFWMTAEAIQLHRKLVTVFKPNITSYVKITMAICWGRLVHVENESNTVTCIFFVPYCLHVQSYLLQWFQFSLWCSPWLHTTTTTFIQDCKEFDRILPRNACIQCT